MDKNDDRPHPQREVSSKKPYVEESSVPGDNDPKTALDPSLAARHEPDYPPQVTAK